MSDGKLAGATAVVTGASRGFGRGIAVALGAAGAQVVGVARTETRWQNSAANSAGCSPGGRRRAHPVVAGELIDKTVRACWS